MIISRKDALTIARDTLIRDGEHSAANTIQKMIDQLSKPLTEEQRQARNAANRARRIAQRKAEVAPIIPILRGALDHFRIPITASELLMACAGDLPGHYTTANIQHILSGDMAAEVDRVDIGKNRPYGYILKRD